MRYLYLVNFQRDRALETDRERTNRIAELEASIENRGILGPIIDELKTRISELEDSLCEERELSTNLSTENSELRQRIEVDIRSHAEEVKTLVDSVELMKVHLNRKSSEESANSDTALTEQKAAKEKLLVSNSSLERRVHACEIVIERNLEIIESKDAIIAQFQERHQDASKSFISSLSALDVELKSRAIEIEAAYLSKARLEIKIMNLEQDIAAAREDRKAMKSALNELETCRAEIAHLRRENQRLKSLNAQILGRGLPFNSS